VNIRTILVLVALLIGVDGSANERVRSRFITTSDGVRIHCLVAGSGPAIVFVPGWTMPAEVWEAQIDYFSLRFSVVAIDPRSHGRSGKPADGHYAERLALDIKEVIDQLKLQPAVLVGWSLGVPQILTYVDQFGTSTVRALVLVDAAIGRDRDADFSAQIWRRLKSF